MASVGKALSGGGLANVKCFIDSIHTECTLRCRGPGAGDGLTHTVQQVPAIVPGPSYSSNLGPSFPSALCSAATPSLPCLHLPLPSHVRVEVVVEWKGKILSL